MRFLNCVGDSSVNMSNLSKTMFSKDLVILITFFLVFSICLFSSFSNATTPTLTGASTSPIQPWIYSPYSYIRANCTWNEPIHEIANVWFVWDDITQSNSTINNPSDGFFNKIVAGFVECPNYGAILDGMNMTGNRLLYHLNMLSGAAIDYSGNNYNGTYQGYYTQGISGKLNNATYFNGTGGRILSTNPILSGTTDFTISAWIKRDANGNFDYIVGNRGTANVGGFQFVISNSNVMNLRIGATTKVGTITIPLNTWTHVSVVRSSATIYFYFNGALDDSSGGGGISIAVLLNASVGSEPDAYTTPFNGSVDEVAIWNRALSSSEIATLYLVQNRLSANVNNHSWKCCANDTIGQTACSSIFDYNVTSGIQVFAFISSPSNLSYSNTVNVTANFTMTSSEGNIVPTANCTRLNDGIFYASSIVARWTSVSDSFIGLSYGQHNYSVNCTNGSYSVASTVFFSTAFRIADQTMALTRSTVVNSTLFSFILRDKNTDLPSTGQAVNLTLYNSTGSVLSSVLMSEYPASGVYWYVMNTPWDNSYSAVVSYGGFYVPISFEILAPQSFTAQVTVNSSSSVNLTQNQTFNLNTTINETLYNYLNSATNVTVNATVLDYLNATFGFNQSFELNTTVNSTNYNYNILNATFNASLIASGLQYTYAIPDYSFADANSQQKQGTSPITGMITAGTISLDIYSVMIFMILAMALIAYTARRKQ